MTNKNYLILLTETERSMLEESLTHCINDSLFMIKNESTVREKEKANGYKLLEKIKSFTGGVRKVISEDHLYYLQHALRWYSDFVPTTNKKEDSLGNAYRKLSYVIEQRNHNSYLFDFDPQNYNPNEKKNILTHDFSKIRYLIARENDGKINYMTEVGQNEGESEANYKQRVLDSVARHAKTNKTGHWLMISTLDAHNYQYAEDLGYFTHNQHSEYYF